MQETLETLMMGTSTTLTTKSLSCVSCDRDSSTGMPRTEVTSIIEALIFPKKVISSKTIISVIYIGKKLPGKEIPYMDPPMDRPPNRPQTDPPMDIRPTPQWTSDSPPMDFRQPPRTKVPKGTQTDPQGMPDRPSRDPRPTPKGPQTDPTHAGKKL